MFSGHCSLFTVFVLLFRQLGIGADDAFILCKTWQCAKAENCNLTLTRLVQNSLKHSAISMFVTTLTTAAAFYASYVSAITAIRCFRLAHLVINYFDDR